MAVCFQAILKNEIINDRLTEISLKQKRQDLQKEAAELTSYIKQNQDVTQTLINICQRWAIGYSLSLIYNNLIKNFPKSIKEKKESWGHTLWSA